MKFVLLFITLFIQVHGVFALEVKPSEESIKQFLIQSDIKNNIEKKINSMSFSLENMKSSDASIKEMEAAIANNNTDPKTKEYFKSLLSGFGEITEFEKNIKQELSWVKIEAMYVQIFQEEFSQTEMIELISFYKSKAGVARINKLPNVVINVQKKLNSQLEVTQKKYLSMIDEIVLGFNARGTK